MKKTAALWLCVIMLVSSASAQQDIQTVSFPVKDILDYLSEAAPHIRAESQLSTLRQHLGFGNVVSLDGLTVVNNNLILTCDQKDRQLTEQWLSDMRKVISSLELKVNLYEFRSRDGLRAVMDPAVKDQMKINSTVEKTLSENLKTGEAELVGTLDRRCYSATAVTWALRDSTDFVLDYDVQVIASDRVYQPVNEPITLGLTGRFCPWVLPDGSILFNYNVFYSNLGKREEFHFLDKKDPKDPGMSRVDTITVGMRNVCATPRLQSGTEYILAAFEDEHPFILTARVTLTEKKTPITSGAEGRFFYANFPISFSQTYDYPNTSTERRSTQSTAGGGGGLVGNVFSMESLAMDKPLALLLSAIPYGLDPIAPHYSLSPRAHPLLGSDMEHHLWIIRALWNDEVTFLQAGSVTMVISGMEKKDGVEKLRKYLAGYETENSIVELVQERGDYAEKTSGQERRALALCGISYPLQMYGGRGTTYFSGYDVAAGATSGALDPHASWKVDGFSFFRNGKTPGDHEEVTTCLSAALASDFRLIQGPHGYRYQTYTSSYLDSRTKLVYEPGKSHTLTMKRVKDGDKTAYLYYRVKTLGIK